MAAPDLDPLFQGIWQRALNAPSLTALTPDRFVGWAREKGLFDAVVEAREVGAFHSKSCIVLKAGGRKACFPLVPTTGDLAWRERRAVADADAVLWDRMEWFSPLWLPLGEVGKMLASARYVDRARAVEMFDYHNSTLYTLPFQAVCIEQIMPQARSLSTIVPLAREAYLAVYSSYRASSIAALIPAIEGSLTRIVSDLPADASTPQKIDHAIGRAVRTAAELHFEDMWVPEAYLASDYLFGEDERVFAFETFGRWLKRHFFCRTTDYEGVTWLNRHMFAHGTVSSWVQPGNFRRLIVALATLAAIESWYDASHQVSFFLPEMDDASTLLWQQAMLRSATQLTTGRVELQLYQENGRLVPALPADNGVTLRRAVLEQECIRDLVRPLRDAGWSVEVSEPDARALFMTVIASCGEKRLHVALLFSCGTENALYRQLAERCDAILYRGAPYRQASFAHGVDVHVGPVLGWQPPRAG